MKSSKQIVPGIVALALCATAAAHSVVGDGWNTIVVGSTTLMGTGNSVTVNPSALPEGISLAGISSLSFSPGTEFSSYFELTRVTNTGDQSAFYAAADEWLWSSSSGEEAVSVTATSLTGAPTLNNAPILTVSVGYGDANEIPPPGCSGYTGETASVTVNGNTYTAKNACQLASGTGDLVFKDGVLEAGSGVGWTLTSTSTAQAPELDSASAAGGLTLLLGSLLVVRGRRPGHARAACASQLRAAMRPHK